ncbi:MAG: YggS family pyridoxal phosphate-dependent enzyme [Proteobacteria bacterium]|nr:YggS family pyridoxal phosphate-dependent enzyme [Pseudomonadota bacterium]
MTTATILNQLDCVRLRIARAATNAGRNPTDVALLAVSKTQSADAVRAAHTAGQRAFGENYVQEAVTKMDALADLAGHIEWHLIGPLQANKTRVVAERFDWVQSVDRLRIAQRLSDQRPAWLAPLNICIQVNISGEASKSGAEPTEVPALAQAIAALPRLALRGLMAVPAPGSGAAPHRALRELAHSLGLATLSMGMSDDLELAIAEGSTLVRVGTAIFGARAPQPPSLQSG